MGIGVVSDTEAQPMLVTTHMGRFAVATVSRIVNLAELEQRCLKLRQTFSGLNQGMVNPTELVAMLIAEGDTITSGIENVYAFVKGSCSMLNLSEDGIIAARDKPGMTPIVIGKKEGAYAVAFESCVFPT
jgi:amidophosphoribosyltransferase